MVTRSVPLSRQASFAAVKFFESLTTVYGPLTSMVSSTTFDDVEGSIDCLDTVAKDSVTVTDIVAAIKPEVDGLTVVEGSTIVD